MESTRGFVFSQANEKHTLFIMEWWEKIKTEEETINGKINREPNLTWPETGFEPKQLGTQRNKIFYIWETGDAAGQKDFSTARWKKKVYDHPLYFILFPVITTRGQRLFTHISTGFYFFIQHNILYSMYLYSIHGHVVGGIVYVYVSFFRLYLSHSFRFRCPKKITTKEEGDNYSLQQQKQMNHPLFFDDVCFCFAESTLVKPKQYNWR